MSEFAPRLFYSNRINTAKWFEKYKRWQINVQKNNERRSFYSSMPGRKGQRECNAKADAWLDDNIDNQNKSMDTLFNEYIESLKLTTSKCHWIKYDAFGRNWIIPKKGRKKIANVSEQDLQDIINNAFAKGNLSKKVLQNLRACLKNFLKFCRKNNATKLFPENLTIPSKAKTSTKRILQPQDLHKLFTSDKTTMRGKEVFDRFIYAYRFQVLTGLRPGELRGLKNGDVVGDIVYIFRSINSHGEITDGKNENAKRKFALTKMAKEVLAAQKTLNLDSKYIFGDISLSTYEKRFTKYCAHNGIPHTTLYELRHTFVSIAKKLSEGQIKPIVGHSKNMDTFGTYGHEVEGELQDTANDLSRLFSDVLKSANVENEFRQGGL